MPLFCGEAVVSYRVADVAELERKASPTFLLRFVSLRFPLLRFTSCCFALLRVSSCCSALFPGIGLGSVWVFDLFYLILLRFALLRSVWLCFDLLRFGMLRFALLRFVLLGFAWPSLCFASFRVASLRFASLCWNFHGFASLCFLREVCAPSGSVLGSFWERLGRYFRSSGQLKRAS